MDLIGDSRHVKAVMNRVAKSDSGIKLRLIYFLCWEDTFRGILYYSNVLGNIREF